MLSFDLVLDPNSNPADEIYIAGVSAYEVGGSWNALGSSATERPDGEITANGHEYLVLERQAESEALEKEETYTGEALVEAFGLDGLSDGVIHLSSTKFEGPEGLFALGSGLYISQGPTNSGLAYRLTSGQPPASTELKRRSAMR